MTRSISSNVYLVFNLICLFAAISLTSYWVYVFTLNEDLCRVDYKKYYEREQDVFPVLSLCLDNPISSMKLKRLDKRVNVSTYLKFLKGNVYDQSLPLINYSSVIRNMTGHIEEDFIRYRNGSFIALHPEYNHDDSYGNNVAINQNKRNFPADYAFFFYSQFYNCPDKNLASGDAKKKGWVIYCVYVMFSRALLVLKRGPMYIVKI